MKIKLYIFIIIIISILALILIQINNTKELFLTGNTDFNYRKIDRITRGNNTHSYCIGGKITCKKSPALSFPIEIKNDGYLGGKTYESYCKTDGVVDLSNTIYCDGTMFATMNRNKMPNYRLPKSGFKFPISVDYLGMTQPYSYVPAAIDEDNENKLNFMKDQNGTVVEYMDICDVYYQTNEDSCKRKLYKSINAKTIIGKAVSDHSYTTIENEYNPGLWNRGYEPDDTSDYSFMNTHYNKASSGSNKASSGSNNSSSGSNNSSSGSNKASSGSNNSSSGSNKASSGSNKASSGSNKASSGSNNKASSGSNKSSSGSNNSSYPNTDCGAKIPCVADFGSDIGDSLCCGQLGVLQNTKNVCPSTKPKCTNFDCKTQLGYCQ
jgi:hypothetical protein